MPRTLTAETTAGLLAQQSDIALLLCAVIENDGLTTPLHIVNNGEDISVNGDTYTAIGFQFDEPEDREDGFGSARLTLNNADQWLTEHIRSLSGEITITFMLVSASDETADPPEFDNVEIEYMPMQLRDVDYNSQTVRGQLIFQNATERRVPAHAFTPRDFPGIF